jgi:hypothetical protein
MVKENSLNNLPPATREIIAENMKERIYSTITLLAVLTAMWQTAGNRTTMGVIASIVGAVVAVWLATLIAARMSYRAVHGKAINGSDYRRTFFTASGLLAPAIPPILIIALSGISGWYSLHTALLSAMIISLLSLFLLSYNAGSKIYDNIWRLLLVSTLEMSVGVGVILLKLAVGE